MLFCQKDSNELLQCPAKSKHIDIGIDKGYATLSANILQFSELNEFPMPINLERLDEGNGLEETMMSNKAMWHKSCSNKFNVTKLLRAQKRKCATEDRELESIAARKYPRRSVTIKDVCFFCSETGSESEPFCEAATLQLDSHVRKCVHDLQDESLLAKLSAGDMISLEAKYHHDAWLHFTTRLQHCKQRKDTVEVIGSIMELHWQSCWHTLMKQV